MASEIIFMGYLDPKSAETHMSPKTTCGSFQPPRIERWYSFEELAEPFERPPQLDWR
jgi:hypothetical protein